ncbi:MFS transporter [Thermodesulfobacteriota bacterium]
METARLQKADPKIFYGYVIVAAAWITFVAAFGVHYSFGVFLKPMLAEFGWGRAATSGAYSLSWLLQGLSAIIMGRINDRYGPRLVLTICGTLHAAGILLTTCISAGWHLYLSYGLLTGLATGGLYVPVASTIARWFIVRRNVMTGIAMSGMGLGTFLLSPVANYIISAYDWRTSYIILGIFVFVVIVFAAQFFRRDPAQMGLRPYGQPRGQLKAKAQRTPEEDHGHTLKEAMGMPGFWIMFGMFFCFGFCVLAIMVHIAPHATDMGKSPATAANFVASIGVASLFGKILLGSLGDRIGSRRVFIICFSLMAASLFWLVPAERTLFLFLFAVAFGLAYGGNASSQSPLLATSFGLRSHGLIFGVANNGFTIGATLGPVVAGAVFDLAGGYRFAFLVVAGVAVAGLALTILLKVPSRGAGAARN